MKIRIATRKSPLALAQVYLVGAWLRELEPSLEIEEVQLVSKGDQILDVPLAKVGGKGLFVAEVEQALVDGRADLAVHSMKDVPNELAAGMGIIAIPLREDPLDVLISPNGDSLFDLPAGSRIGTSSLRRAVQLRGARNDLSFHVLRGNVGTRLRKLDEGQYDAIVLAAAGMRRLDLLSERKHSLLPVEVSIPAVGQGALALETPEGESELNRLISRLDHRPTRVAVEAERAFLGHVQGSCTTPLACHARWDDSEAGQLRLDAVIGSLDGETLLRGGAAHWISLDDSNATERARAAGRDLADQLLAGGADKLLQAARSSSDPYSALYSRTTS